MATTDPSTVTSQPKPRRTSAVSGTSRMSGQLVIVVVPSANSAAAISLRTLFFAPPTATSPTSRLPPVTRNRSLTGASLTGGLVGRGRSADLRSPGPPQHVTVRVGHPAED